MTDEKQPQKGFAGLNDLVSDVESVRPEPQPQAPESTASHASINEPPGEEPFRTGSTSGMIPPPKKSRMLTGDKWILGLVGGFIVIALLSSNDKNSSSGSSNSYTPPSQYQPPVPVAPPEPYEDKPPFGTDVVLSASQIRYCLSQGIRLEGWRSTVNQYSDSSVVAFNAAIQEYNGRCGSYRYRSSVLNRVKSEVESQRASLYSVGVSLSIRNP